MNALLPPPPPPPPLCNTPASFFSHPFFALFCFCTHTAAHHCTAQSHMDDRGASMTDTSPLIKIKQGLTKLKVNAHLFVLLRRRGCGSVQCMLTAWLSPHACTEHTRTHMHTQAEIKTMDLRIGVVGHTLMQSKIK